MLDAHGSPSVTATLLQSVVPAVDASRAGAYAFVAAQYLKQEIPAPAIPPIVSVATLPTEPKPTPATVTSPPDGSVHASASVLLTGTASDNEDLARIELEVNGAPVFEASGTTE